MAVESSVQKMYLDISSLPPEIEKQRERGKKELKGNDDDEHRMSSLCKCELKS